MDKNKLIRILNKIDDENKELTNKVNVLKKRVSKSIPKDDVNLLLNILLPFDGLDEQNDALLNHASFMDLFNVNLSRIQLLNLICTLVKLKRENLASYFYRYFINEVYDENEEINVEKSLYTIFSYFKKRKEMMKCQLLFDVLLLANKIDANGTKEFLEAEASNFATLLLKIEDTKEITQHFATVALISKDATYTVSNYFFHHWALTTTKLAEDQMTLWTSVAKFSGHQGFLERITKKAEDFNIQKNGLHFSQRHSNNMNTESAGDNGFASKLKPESELKKLGYEVSRKTDRQRQAALLKAAKYLSISSMVNHIEYLLTRSRQNHSLGKKDYSNSINAYEMDLNFLEKTFNTRVNK